MTIVILVLLNVLTPHHDWHVLWEREWFEGCRYIDIQWWRFQKPWTGVRIELYADSKECDVLRK